MDQAERLRQLMYNKTDQTTNNGFKVITVSSGKGGVGKTNFVINLAIALQANGHKVAILDADFGMANVDILFGVRASSSIYDILYNDKTIDEVTVKTDNGIKIIPGGSGIKELSEIDDSKREKLINEFSKINDIDILIVDTGAGFSKNVLSFIEVADEIIIVTNPEPTSLTDAYSLIKVITKNNISSNLNLVVNRVRNTKEAQDTFNKISNAVQVFLDKKIKYLGFISDDSKVGQSVREQVPFCTLYPKCEASLCIHRIALEVSGVKNTQKSNSVREYFSKLLRIMNRK